MPGLGENRDSQVLVDKNLIGARVQSLLRPPNQVEPLNRALLNVQYHEHFSPSSEGSKWIDLEIIASLATNLGVASETLLAGATLPNDWNAAKYFRSQPASVQELLSAILETCVQQDDILAWAQAIRENHLSGRVARVQSRLSHRTEWERYRQAT